MHKEIVNQQNIADKLVRRCIAALDKRRQRGGDHKSQIYRKTKPSIEGIYSGKSASAKETASIVGVSRAKVERARTVLDRADEEVKAAVKEGKLSIHRAYEITRSKTKQATAPEKPENVLEVAEAALAVATALPEPQTEQPLPPPQSEQYQKDLRQALAELLAWRQKYRHLCELGNVFAVIDSFEPCQVRLVKG